MERASPDAFLADNSLAPACGHCSVDLSDSPDLGASLFQVLGVKNGHKCSLLKQRRSRYPRPPLVQRFEKNAGKNKLPTVTVPSDLGDVSFLLSTVVTVNPRASPTPVARIAPAETIGTDCCDGYFPHNPGQKQPSWCDQCLSIAEMTAGSLHDAKKCMDRLCGAIVGRLDIRPPGRIQVRDKVEDCLCQPTVSRGHRVRAYRALRDTGC